MANADPGDEVATWFAHHVPAEWAASVELEVDTEEIMAVVDLPPGVVGEGGFGAGDEGRLAWFRAQTRDERVAIAAAAEARFGRKVSWGARCGGCAVAFTTASVPVMTRLRMPERRVLDTLIDAGVARSRSEALAWCVRLVGDNEEQWIARLRAAFEAVEEIRREGPAASR